MRTIALALTIALTAAAAQAQSLQVTGKFGYLGEYELSARIAPLADTGETEFSGPLTVKHVGLCTHEGPPQYDGRITLRMAGLASPVTATLLFDGRECTFRGKLSETDIGEIACPGAPALPISMWPKE